MIRPNRRVRMCRTAAQVERSVHVDCERVFPFVVRHLISTVTAAVRFGLVDEDVQLSEACDHALHQAIGLLRISHVSWKTFDVEAKLPEFLDGCLCPLRGTIVDGDSRTSSSERTRNDRPESAPKTTTRTSHERDHTVKVAQLL